MLALPLLRKEGAVSQHTHLLPRAEVFCMNIPRCPICHRPRKVRPKTSENAENHYYATCGQKHCVLAAMGTKTSGMIFRVGKRFTAPHIPSLASQRKCSSVCWRCGGEKEIGKIICSLCKKKDLGRRIAEKRHLDAATFRPLAIKKEYKKLQLDHDISSLETLLEESKRTMILPTYD